MEGLEECFTINRLDVPPSLHRCLAPPISSRIRTPGFACGLAGCAGGLDGVMVKRWMASALLASEKNFRKIMGYRDLWALDAIPKGCKSATRREVA
jgi:hypothetical protein